MLKGMTKHEDKEHIWPKARTNFQRLAFVTYFMALLTTGDTQVISICCLTEILEQPRGGTPALNVMVIRHQHHTKQLFHAFVDNNQNHRFLCAVDDLCTVALGLTASGNSASGCPQHLGADNFDCCPRRHELDVYFRRPLQNSPLESFATMSRLFPFCIMLELEKKTFLYRDLSLINAWCCVADVNINSLRLRRRELIFRSLPSNPMRQ